MKRTHVLLPAVIAALAFAMAGHAGGWAIVSVDELPGYAVAGKPFQLAYTVWKGDGEPIDGLMPTVLAKSGTDMVWARVVKAKKDGKYVATLVLPRPGNWTIRLNSFDDSSNWESNTLSEFKVIAPGSPAPPPLSQAALGERLFAAKDCIKCHHPIRDVDTLVSRSQAECALTGSRGFMFNQRLSKSEIAALTAFINSDQLR